MSGTATMYWMQWSRSAGLESGPCLSMMRNAGLVGADGDGLMFGGGFAGAASSRAASCAASTAVCEWNSAGKEILKRTFSIT